MKGIKSSRWPVVGSVAALLLVVVALVYQLGESGPISRSDVALISTGVLNVFGLSVLTAIDSLRHTVR